MELTLDRKYRKQNYTIGKLYIDGKYFCDTMEDYDRLYFGGVKVPNETAIPVGRYEVTQNIYSQKFGLRSTYKKVCGGFVPRLMNVKGFDGILIHIGNYPSDTSGCILVGKNTKVGAVLKSTETWTELMNKYLLKAKDRNEKVYITIK